MKTDVRFQCELCSTFYDDPTKASECEASHLRVDQLAAALTKASGYRSRGIARNSFPFADHVTIVCVVKGSEYSARYVLSREYEVKVRKVEE